MTINEIFKLPKTLNTIETIKDFIHASNLNEKTYFNLANFYLECLEANNCFLEILEEGANIISTIKAFSGIDNQQLLQLNDYLLRSSLKLKKIELAKNYLLNKKNLLPSIKKNDFLLDLIYFNKTFEFGLNHLEDGYDLKLISPEYLGIIQEELLNYYLTNKNYALAYNFRVLDHFNTRHCLNNLIIYANLNRDEEFQEAINEDLNILKGDQLCEALLLYLNFLLRKEERHKITILDGEYNPLFSTFSLENQKKLYNFFKKFYKSENNQFSYNEYLKLSNLIIGQLKSLNPAVVKENIAVENHQIEEIPTSAPVAKLAISEEILKNCAYLISYSHQLKLANPLRENLRLFFIEVEKLISEIEIGLYLINNNVQYYYRLERLVDKYILKTNIKNTYIDQVINNQNDLIIHSEELKTLVKIHNGERFDSQGKILYVQCLEDNGAIYILIKEELFYTYFDLLKIIGKISLSIVKDHFNLAQLKYANSYLEGIINSPIPMRSIIDSKSFYNKAAVQLFNITSDYHLDYFYANTDLKSVYKEQVNQSYNHLGTVMNFIFGYDNKYIQESQCSFMVEDDIVILSTFQDITEQYLETKALEEEKTYDIRSGLYNYNSLVDYLTNNLNKKLSLILIRLNNNIANLYSMKQINDYFYEFCGITKKQLSSYNAQSFNFSNRQIMVILENNDQRVISALMDEYIAKMKTYKTISIVNEPYNINAGILRYPNQTTEKNVHKLFNYLNSTLLNNSTKAFQYGYFDMSEYEQFVKEELILKDLIKAIDKQELEISLSPIVKLENNKIIAYLAGFELLNYKVDHQTLVKISKKRGNCKTLDLAITATALQLLNYCYTTYKSIIEIIIPLDYKSVDQDFWEILQKYQISGTNFSFLLNKECPVSILKQFVDKKINFNIASLDYLGLVPCSGLFIPFHEQLLDEEYLNNLLSYLQTYHTKLVVLEIPKAENLSKIKKFNLLATSSIYHQMSSKALLKLLEEKQGEAK
ncbi:MAG: hypothetical protein LBV55_00775 [Acholeplasmatales bacterium]|nr:hypothetical protein [Acholeplasmatales bacterium]